MKQFESSLDPSSTLILLESSHIDCVILPFSFFNWNTHFYKGHTRNIHNTECHLVYSWNSFILLLMSTLLEFCFRELFFYPYKRQLYHQLYFFFRMFFVMFDKICNSFTLKFKINVYFKTFSFSIQYIIIRLFSL